MTIAALREELQQEEVLWGLEMMRRADPWERWETAAALVRRHLPPGVYVRIPLTLMPDWYRNLWWDRTQVDGRAALNDINQRTVELRGIGPGGTETLYRVDTTDFLDAVLAGSIGDAS